MNEHGMISEVIDFPGAVKLYIFQPGLKTVKHSSLNERAKDVEFEEI